ncbi:MAG: hypothetical protein NZM00_03285, partial [Anaerolinea sp.]|nr:hypothetical protein [Anaerolinea sp.]
IPRTGAVFTTPDGVGSITVAPVDRLHRRGDQLDVWLGFWQTNIPPETYSFSLRAVDADGAVLAAVDRGVPPASETGLDRPTCRAVTLAVPPSAERIEIIIYDWRTLEPLRGSPSRIAALQAPSSNSGMPSARADDPDRMKNGQNL